MKNKTSFFDRISCAIADQYIATRSTLTLINPSLFMWSSRPYFYEIVINLDFWLKSHSFYPVIHWKLNLKGILSKVIIIVEFSWTKNPWKYYENFVFEFRKENIWLAKMIVLRIYVDKHDFKKIVQLHNDINADETTQSHWFLSEYRSWQVSEKWNWSDILYLSRK